MRDQRGFTLTELLVTVSIFTVASAMAVAIFSDSIPTIRATSQAQRLIGLMQLARETAIMRQRDVELVLDAAAGRARLVLHDSGTQTNLRDVVFEDGVGFRQFDAQGDTPDEFGADGPIDFGGATRLLFISDGSLVDEDDLPRNGTLFFGIANRRETARAITITGTTARARIFTWSGNGWVE